MNLVQRMKILYALEKLWFCSFDFRRKKVWVEKFFTYPLKTSTFVDIFSESSQNYDSNNSEEN